MAPPPGAPPKVGLLLPLSGDAEALGGDFLDAAQMALFDFGETRLELIPRDTGDDPGRAVAAATEAMNAGAQLLLGPLFGRSTTAVAPLAAQRNVKVISFSNDAAVARPGVWLLGFRPEEQVERVVSYAAAGGLSRQAALAPSDSYGSRAVESWRDAVGRIPGAEAVGVARYQAEGDDPSSAVRSVASIGRALIPAEATAGELAGPGIDPTPPRLTASGPPAFDALLIADGGPRLRAVAATLPRFAIDPATTRLLGTQRWREDPDLLADPAVQGAWLAAWPTGEVQRFTRRFRAIYGRDPDPLAVLAYDATALAALIGQAGLGYTDAQLLDPQGFSGASGLFRLRPDGLVEHGLAILEVRAGSWREIDPAPARFLAETAAIEGR